MVSVGVVPLVCCICVLHVRVGRCIARVSRLPSGIFECVLVQAVLAHTSHVWSRSRFHLFYC